MEEVIALIWVFIAVPCVLVWMIHKNWFEKEEVKRKQCRECYKTFYETQTRVVHNMFTGQKIREKETCPYCYSDKWEIV